MIGPIQRNLIANLAGVGWGALAQFICIPIYVHLMGIESYGLIGFYAMLTGVLQILDLGMTPTLNREMARYSVQPDKAAEARDLVRTLEVSYWSIGIIIGLGVVTLAPVIADRWISPGHLAAGEVRHAVMAMGVIAALQWPLSFYTGGLMGLQRQILANSLRIWMYTLSHGGALLVLCLVSPTITAYFSWQIAVMGLQVVLVTHCLWVSLPRASRAARFSPALIKGIWRFAVGMSGITLSSLILTQMDKIMLSKLLSLEDYGYYTLAGILGTGLYVLIGPMFSTFFPRFSTLVAEHDEVALRALYHRAMQILAVLLLPVAAVMVGFSEDILLAWTGNPHTARVSAPIVSWLIMGTALNGLMNMPYALQLAYGWTRLGVTLNLVLVTAMVPAIYLLVNAYGAVGGGMAWCGFNATYLLVGVGLTHSRLLRGDAWRWFAIDVGLPLIAVLMIVGIGRILIFAPLTPVASMTLLPALVLVAMFGAAVMAPEVRGRIRQLISRRVTAKPVPR